jgi:hypothetical protein
MGLKKKMLCLATVVLTGVLTVWAVIWANAGEAPIRAEPLPQPKAAANLPVIQQTSKPTKTDNLEFQIVSSTIWPLPARIGKSPPEIPAGQSRVQFQLRVTNHGNKEVRLLSIVGDANPPVRRRQGVACTYARQ